MNNETNKETLLITIEIKSNAQGWMLEVINNITGKTFLCQSLEEMNETIETLYSLYPDHELQVMWLPSHEAYPEHVEEIRGLINAIQQQLNEGV